MSTVDPTLQSLDESVSLLRSTGIGSIRSFAWRDLDDPEAGGSEVHANEIFTRWVHAGLDVHLRTSALSGGSIEPRAYRSEQRGGRYSVFASVIGHELTHRSPPGSAVVEIWNGVPWFSSLWRRAPGVTWLHHVHRHMWDDALPRPLNVAGRYLETRLAPRFYRGSPVVTLSQSSRLEIEQIGIPAASLTVIPPGIHQRFSPDETMRSTFPSAIVVGRLAPVKRTLETLRALEPAHDRHPSFIVNVVGDGPLRADIQRWIADRNADWVHLHGRIDDDHLVRLYRQSWLVVSGSQAEGWGMSLTEAAACATPSVATDIAGHRDAMTNGLTGILVPTVTDIGNAVGDLLDDTDRRMAMQNAALQFSRQYSWDAVAARQLAVVALEAKRRSSPKS